MPAMQERPRLARWWRRPGLWVFLVALIPAGWSLGSSWIAEDTAILGYASGGAWWADWLGPQYGVRVVSSFWRPVISTAWGLQALFPGAEPGFFRALNLLAHASCAGVLFALLRRLGVAELGALLGAVTLGFFPEQGGTVTWISGRTDLLGALSMLLTLLCVFSKHWILALPLAFLACATKEFAFLLPAWVLILNWTRDGGSSSILGRRFLVVLAGCVLAFCVRRLALGTWGGGYPARLPSLPAGIAGTARAIASSWHPGALLLLPLLGLARAAGTLAPRLALAGGGLWLLGVAPLYPLLADGYQEAQNVRLYFVADIGLCVLMASTLARPLLGQVRSKRALQLALGLGFAALLGTRAKSAFEDVSEWSRAAREAEAHERNVRALVAGAEPSDLPVFYAEFPRSYEGAYCMGFGVADRFRAPFEQTPRPIWPWRSVFGFGESERPPRASLRQDGSLWPEDDAALLERLAVTVEGSPQLTIRVDERVLQADPALAPQLVLDGLYPGLGFELMVYTPSGYEAVILGPLGPGATHRLSLKTLFEHSNGTSSVATVLQHAADLGATRAYLELRLLNTAGEPLGLSPLVELTWDADFLSRTL